MPVAKDDRMLRALAAAAVAVIAATGLMHVQSGDFVAGRSVGQAFMATECGGQNESPGLRWSGSPARTKSFAIVLHDADAPLPGGFYHWVVYDLPAQTHGLRRDAEPSASQLGVNSAGQARYRGPCPPPGPAHHYVLTVYALDLARVADGAALRGAQLESRIAGHVLARGLLKATASHP